ncbi:hypothetical protein [Flavobacterium sp.]|uniref:hypothetical protein n=1 Tax=Flavobacterium sp. TaxID=239 RepID=UPI00260A2855|nr:hypothetical protein [Flavobacterium sp.]MDD3004538.1 hypothetical protein [Flavobacterium sp.]
MKSLFTFALVVFSALAVQSQDIEKLKDEVLKEAFLMYESEKASWHGTDLFIEQYTNTANIGGYVSYTDNKNPKCIFVSKEDKNKVIGTITFDKTFDLTKAKVDLKERNLSALEKKYFLLREKTMTTMGNDTIFKYYKNTKFNIVPLITKEKQRAYVLTASTSNGKVLIGNDYLIEFDNKSEVVKTSRLHRSLLSFDYGGYDKKITGGAHNHLIDFCPIMTATDICTLMLYQDYTNWESHTVVSKDYTSTWDCEKRELTVEPNEK